MRVVFAFHALWALVSKKRQPDAMLVAKAEKKGMDDWPTGKKTRTSSRTYAEVASTVKPASDTATASLFLLSVLV